MRCRVKGPLTLSLLPVDFCALIRYPVQLTAGWSRLVARRAHNPKVASSNLAPATNQQWGLTPWCKAFFAFLGIKTIAFFIFIDKIEKMAKRIRERCRRARLKRCMLMSVEFCLLMGVLAFAAWCDEPSRIDAQKEVLVQKLLAQGFDEGEARAVFEDKRVRLYPEIIGRTGKGIDYFHRKFGLFTPASIERGRQVLRENAAALQEIERLFGVEKEVLVAVYRLETNFGRYTGERSVFNSLLTLAVIENRRSAWAEKEWINLMVLSRKRALDPLSIKGSWAGAFGLVQFVPSSYLVYAVDGNGDGEIDLFNVVDALASVANYLKLSGWDKTSVAKQKKAIYAYNHCDDYVKAVLAYAEATRKAPVGSKPAGPKRGSAAATRPDEG
jgi:membrane-bound lytic murein transglycosylase B